MLTLTTVVIDNISNNIIINRAKQETHQNHITSKHHFCLLVSFLVLYLKRKKKKYLSILSKLQQCLLAPCWKGAFIIYYIVLYLTSMNDVIHMAPLYSFNKLVNVIPTTKTIFELIQNKKHTLSIQNIFSTTIFHSVDNLWYIFQAKSSKQHIYSEKSKQLIELRKCLLILVKNASIDWNVWVREKCLQEIITIT